MVPWWLVLFNLVPLLLAGVAFWKLNARTVHLGVSNEQLRLLQNDLSSLCSCQAEAAERDQAREALLRATEDRIEAIEQRLRQLSRRQDEQTTGAEPSYGAAIRLAHQGADADQLVSTFGLVRGEAELITALHRGQRERERN
ncbi:conserved hypothetical protein [Gammaproteobacteria bacterium]